MIGFVRLNGNKLILPFSNSYKKTHKSVEIKMPPILFDKKLKKFVSYLKLMQGSLKSSTSMKPNVFKEISILTMHLLWIWV